MTDPLARVRRGFTAQGFMGTLGAELELIEPGRCHIAVPFARGLTQQHGLFHGGVTATLADNAAGFAACSLMADDEEPLTVEFKINFIAPARGDALVGKGHVLKNGRRLRVVEASVFSRDAGEEALIAAALVTITSTRSVSAPTADAALAADTQGVYERQAARFDAERPKKLLEQAWLDRFLERVRPGGRVLDLGCGAGDPIARYLMDRGYDVVGVDASEAMLAIARNRFPEGDWRRADMRDLDLPEAFDGVIGWDSFFHLMPDEQRHVLPLIARHMAEGAALMLTVGHEAGEVVGTVGGEPVYHSSLSPSEYEDALRELGVELVEFVPEDPSCDFHTILLGRKGSR